MALPLTGYPITKIDLDNRIGAAIVTLRDAFNTIASLKVLLDDASILANSTGNMAALGYNGTDEATVRAAFTDMVTLYNISKGLATQPTTNDFWFNAKHLAGLNFH